jgi:hypothetical protein
MNASKWIAMAGWAAVIGLGSCPASNAQVSCSPRVPVRTCKEVARLLDVPLKLETGRGGVQLELVSPAEFKARVNQFRKDLRLEPLEPIGCAPGAEKLFFLNCEDVDVLFLRDGSSDRTPKRILVSSEEAANVLALRYFVLGYYAGLTAGRAEEQNEK